MKKEKEGIRGVVIVYSVRNEEVKKKKLLYNVYNRARWRHEARHHTNDPYPPLRAQARRSGARAETLLFVSDIEVSRREQDVCTCEVSEKRVGCACDEGRA